MEAPEVSKISMIVVLYLLQMRVAESYEELSMDGSESSQCSVPSGFDVAIH